MHYMNYKVGRRSVLHEQKVFWYQHGIIPMKVFCTEYKGHRLHGVRPKVHVTQDLVCDAGRQ